MRMGSGMLAGLILSGLFVCGCGGGNGSGAATTPPPATSTPAAAPTATPVPAPNGAAGAVVVTVASTTPGATIYYSLDGSTPTTTSQVYQAPFLVATNLTVQAIATASGFTTSSVMSKSFTPNIPPNTLVWSDEFSNGGTTNALPDSKVWAYDTGNGGFGNNEMEDYCAAGSTASPCDPASPNAYADTSGILHIVARQPAAGVYTSARLKTQGLFTFQYGRIEAKMMIPESQGMWPAFWLLGSNINLKPWPACGELDVLEHIDGANPPPYAGAASLGYDWVQSSVHGTNLNGGVPYHPAGFSAAAWHTYGMIWSKGQIQYYVDDPTNIYETFTSSTAAGTWPFDDGPQFILLNLAVGGSWPGNPDATTVFPGDMQVDYVRIYTN